MSPKSLLPYFLFSICFITYLGFSTATPNLGPLYDCSHLHDKAFFNFPKSKIVPIRCTLSTVPFSFMLLLYANLSGRQFMLLYANLSGRQSTILTSSSIIVPLKFVNINATKTFGVRSLNIIMFMLALFLLLIVYELLKHKFLLLVP